MTILESIILGAIEGITEFLPISSTAHLMIGSRLLGIAQTDFVKSFEIAIQLGAVSAVLILYTRSILKNPALIGKIIAGFIPTAIIGFTLYPFIKTNLLGNFTAVFWSLFLGGLFFIGYEIYERKTAAMGFVNDGKNGVEKISFTQAFIIGIFQSAAVIPGISRSAATIFPGLILGLSRSTAVEFSFLLALPTIAAATGYDFIKNTSVFDGNMGIAIIGFTVSLITAIFAIRFLLSFIRTHSFVGFGIYRIIVAFLILFLVL